tara:strand:- start:11 stop:607 length:597 start_codon:yes stop_codon:yes gene_type:complete
MKSISINLVLFWLLGSIAQAQLQNNYSQYEVTRLRDISLKGTSISILALNGLGFEISTVTDKSVYKGFSLASDGLLINKKKFESSDSLYHTDIFVDYRLGKKLSNGWATYLSMGINYNARKINQTVSLSILGVLEECDDFDTTCEEGLNYDDANFSFNDEKVFFNYGVGINKLVGEKYLIGLEYSKHRLLVIKLGYNF